MYRIGLQYWIISNTSCRSITHLLGHQYLVNKFINTGPDYVAASTDTKLHSVLHARNKCINPLPYKCMRKVAPPDGGKVHLESSPAIKQTDVFGEIKSFEPYNHSQYHSDVLFT